MSICASWMRGTDVDGIRLAISATSASSPCSPQEGYCSRADLPGCTNRLDPIRRTATRTEADDEIVTPDNRFDLPTKGRRIAHIVADGREQGRILGQDERQQSLGRTWMRTDTLHCGGDMLRIAGTPSIPTEHYLPLASEGGNYLTGDLHDEMRHGCQLVDDGEMLF
jgi:hypothetical protein